MPDNDHIQPVVVDHDNVGPHNHYKPDDDKRRRLYYLVHDAITFLNNVDFYLATGGDRALRYSINGARTNLDAAIELLDNDRQSSAG